MKKALVACGSLVLGLLFLLSGWFKLFPIEPFEYKLVETSPLGWNTAVFAARLLIAFELAIGVLLLFSYQLKTTLKIAFLALLIFSLHLIYVLLIDGNTGDCGCMGQLMRFTPAQGLLKNTLMIGLILLLYKFAFHFELKWPHVVYSVFLIALCVVFIVNPVDLTYSEKYLSKDFKRFELSLDTLYSPDIISEKVEQPALDFRLEKTILAFVSASCPHCKIAVQKLAVINKLNKNIPMYMFINGDDLDIQTFLEHTNSTHIPHSKLNGQVFVDLAGLNLPVLYYYNQGKIDKQVDYYTLEQSHIEEWLKNN